MNKYARLLIFFIGIAILGLLAYVAISRRGSGPARSEVALRIEAPETVTGGDEVSFIVHYTNYTRNTLKKAELFFRYPEGALPLDADGAAIQNISVGDLAAGEERKEEFRARLVGPKGAVRVSQVEMSYSVGGISAFRKTAEATTRITESAFILNFNVPQRAVSGERIVYFLDYVNTASHPYGQIRVRLSYPEGFSFVSADPAPTEGNAVWDIGEVPQDGRGRIAIYGTLTGNEGETKKVRAEIGLWEPDRFFPYAESAFETIVSPPPLAISLVLRDKEGDAVRLGESLTLELSYKNTSEVVIKGGVLSAEFSGGLFDPKSIQGEHARFDSLRNTLTWTPANVPELAFLNPGSEQKVLFRARLKESFPITSTNDRNFVARIVSTIESLDVPNYLALPKIIVSHELQLKVGTVPELAAKGFYRDTASDIQNFGPIPPRVNQETTYTVHWQIAVPANDLENIEVRTTLPTGVRATGRTLASPNTTVPRFDDITGEVVWTLDRVPANTGYVLPVYEAVFQIAATPSFNQSGQAIELVRDSTLIAHDVFTGEDLTVRAPAIRSNLPDDPTIGKEGGTVAP